MTLMVRKEVSFNVLCVNRLMQRTLQETSFRTIKVIALFCAVTAAVYGALDIEPSSLMVLFFWFGPVFAVILWIQSDAKKNSIGTVLDLGFLIYITWPITIPWYVLKTRGRAGWRLLLAFFAVIISRSEEHTSELQSPYVIS